MRYSRAYREREYFILTIRFGSKLERIFHLSNLRSLMPFGKVGLNIAMRWERVVEVPEPAMQYTSDDVKRIRKSLDYSQECFALFLNISKKTVQAWESGRRSPNHAALRLLEVIDTR
ncbi:MAG: helix-turn-helix domain-containing protein [Chlamydiales bacterium]